MAFETYIISWNITKRCNLHCAHCYLDASHLSGNSKDELSTTECFRLIDQMAEVNPKAVLILTGGEPLLRKDIFEISKYASDKGFLTVLGTNGISITDDTAIKIKDSGLKGVGVSLDSLSQERHDSFRGIKGAWDNTIRGIEEIKKIGLEFQIQTTVTRDNYNEIPSIIEFAHKTGSRVFNLFFLVCTGRGEELTDISAEQYEDMLSYVYKIHDKYNGMMIRTKCAPHFKRIAYQSDHESPLLKGYIGGCRAGTNYCRITPEGDVTPCPYMPDTVGNVKNKTFSDIWWNSETFKKLRHPEYKGKCQDCEYKLLCGGCRARALASNNDYMGDDPWCLYKPEGGKKKIINLETDIKYGLEDTENPLLPPFDKGGEGEIIWTDDALKFLENIPFFARTIAKKGVEKYAKEMNYKTITISVMKEAREKRAGKTRFSV
jgi:radical SAM protein with 4Fe4S-binding SPASM domain